MNNIVLIGMMGSGKSTVGLALANALSWRFVDLDSQLEDQEKISIAQLVKEQGMDVFRNKETQQLRAFVESNPSECVLSTGGGIILKDENQSLLKTLGFIVWLKASAQTTYERIKDDSSRPLIQGQTPDQKIKSIKNILEARADTYKQLAHQIVEVDELSCAEVANTIKQLFKSHRKTLR